MEFLVRIDVHLPHDMPAERRVQLAEEERAHGLQLQQRGAIRRIWRIPGGLRNVGIWEASDATELHELISGLPMYSWIRADVTALAQHPLESDQQAHHRGKGSHALHRA